MKTQTSGEVTAKEMIQGDVIRFFDGPFGDGTVFKLATDDDDLVYVRRPFMHADSTEYVGRRVGIYIGHEDVKLWSGSDKKYKLVYRLLNDDGTPKRPE